MQPINYMLDVQQPLQMALAGYTQGQGIRANQQGMEDQRRLMEMQEMQFAQQQQAIQQQQARAQEMQMDMAGIADDVASGQFSPARLFEMQVKYPEVGEYLSGLYTNVSEQQKEGMIDERVRFINLVRNNPELARTKLEERRDAYLNSGSVDEAKAIDAELAQMDTAPEAVVLAHMFEVNALMNDPERFESLAGMIMPPGEELTQAALTRKQLAIEAGFIPGTPEYQQFIRESKIEGGVQINMPGFGEGVVKAGDVPAGTVLVQDPNSPGGVRLVGVTGGPIEEKKTKTVNASDELITNLNDLVTHPGTASRYGLSSLGGFIPAVPGSEAAAGQARINKLRGQIFLAAYDALRGSGTITEVEGIKAEQSKTILLDQNISWKEAQKAAKDLIDIATKAKNRSLGIEKWEGKGGLAALEEITPQQINSMTAEDLAGLDVGALTGPQLRAYIARSKQFEGK